MTTNFGVLEEPGDDDDEDPSLSVEQFDQLIAQQREQLQAEKDAPASREALSEEQDEAARSLDTVRQEISDLKSLARRRKNEIDEWKDWYEQQPDVEKPAALKALESELNWRADELNSMPEKFNVAAEKEAHLANEVEQVRLKLRAFEVGAHELPVEEDPRLLALLEAREAAVETQK